jgi:hypothetical protein
MAELLLIVREWLAGFDQQTCKGVAQRIRLALAQFRSPEDAGPHAAPECVVARNAGPRPTRRPLQWRTALCICGSPQFSVGFGEGGKRTQDR